MSADAAAEAVSIGTEPSWGFITSDAIFIGLAVLSLRRRDWEGRVHGLLVLFSSLLDIPFHMSNETQFSIGQHIVGPIFVLSLLLMTLRLWRINVTLGGLSTLMFIVAIVAGFYTGSPLDAGYNVWTMPNRKNPLFAATHMVAHVAGTFIFGLWLRNVPDVREPTTNEKID